MKSNLKHFVEKESNVIRCYDSSEAWLRKLLDPN